MNKDDNTIASLYVLGFAVVLIFFIHFLTNKKKKSHPGHIPLSNNGLYDIGCNHCHWQNTINGAELKEDLKRTGYFCCGCDNPIYIRKAEKDD